MEKKPMFTEAEAQRNSLMLTLFGLENRIKTAKTTADYIDLIRRTGTLAEFMARVIEKLAVSGETLKPMDEKTKQWIRKQTENQ